MRYIILVLMIALLPLRGWAGDAMATQMASAVIAIETGADRAHEMVGSASFGHQNEPVEASRAVPDCHEHLADSLGGHAPSETGINNDHCGTCQACQACHTAALSPSPLQVTAAFTSPQMRPTNAAAFTSAAAALGQKPPIA